MSTWNIPSGGFCQKNCLLKSERVYPAFTEDLWKSFFWFAVGEPGTVFGF